MADQAAPERQEVMMQRHRSGEAAAGGPTDAVGAGRPANVAADGGDSTGHQVQTLQDTAPAMALRPGETATGWLNRCGGSDCASIMRVVGGTHVVLHTCS